MYLCKCDRCIKLNLHRPRGHDTRLLEFKKVFDLWVKRHKLTELQAISILRDDNSDIPSIKDIFEWVEAQDFLFDIKKQITAKNLV